MSRAPDTPNPAMQLLGLLWPGALAAQSLHVAAVLRLPETIGNDALEVADLADRTGTVSTALHRLLRALAALGVFREPRPGSIENTDLSRLLASDHPHSVRPWALMLGSDWITRSWSALEHSTRTGEPGFRHAQGCRFEEHMAAHPDDAAVYDEAMSTGTAAAVAGILDAYDFSRFHRVVDVGGGRGDLLRAILERHGELEGVLFDLPHVVEGADELRALGERCVVTGGTFFDGIPAGGDLYVLKHVVHSLNDTDAGRLLRHCRDACSSDGTLLLVEGVVDDEAGPDVPKAFMDLMMMTLVGGRERTEPEFRALLMSAGFEVRAVIATAGLSSLVEARPST